MSRWRLRMMVRLPGPWVLSRGSGSLRSRHCHNAGIGRQGATGNGSAVGGFIALFLLGWLCSWKLKTRNRTRKPRVVPGWAIGLGIFVLVALVVIVI